MGKIRLRELDAHKGFEVVACSDFIVTANPQIPNVFFSTSWEEILELDIDAVVVCTYNDAIPLVTCKALKKGLHVFAEKPPGKNLQDVKLIQAAEREAPGKILRFGFNHRFHYAIMEAKTIIESGKYGKILWARGTYGKAGGENFIDNWRSDPGKAGGGILLDQGVHMLDLLNFFIGDFTEVKSYVDNCYWKDIPMEDNAFALLKNNRNQYCFLHSSATQWRHLFKLDIYLEDGYISVNGILSSTRSYGEESIAFAKKQFETESTAFGKPREEIIYFDRDDSWKLEIEDFYNSIEGKGKSIAGNSDDAHTVMNLVEKIYESSQEPGLKI